MQNFQVNSVLLYCKLSKEMEDLGLTRFHEYTTTDGFYLIAESGLVKWYRKHDWPKRKRTAGVTD